MICNSIQIKHEFCVCISSIRPKKVSSIRHPCHLPSRNDASIISLAIESFPHSMAACRPVICPMYAPRNLYASSSTCSSYRYSPLARATVSVWSAARSERTCEVSFAWIAAKKSWKAGQVSEEARIVSGVSFPYTRRGEGLETARYLH